MVFNSTADECTKVTHNKRTMKPVHCYAEFEQILFMSFNYKYREKLNINIGVFQLQCQEIL